MGISNQERRSRYETAVLYVVQSLVVAAIIAGVVSGVNSRVNSVAIDSIRIAIDAMQRSMHDLTNAQQELAKTQQETALINATQTQQLVFMNQALKECKQDLKSLRQ